MTTMLSIVPYLRNERGHFYNYHRAVNAAANQLGWRYFVAAPTDNVITNWPDHWRKCLENPNPTRWPKWLTGIYTKHRYRRSLTRFIEEHAEQNSSAQNIIFVEYISVRQLRPLVMSVLMHPAKRNLSVWMLFHFVPHKLRGSPKDFQRCLKLLLRILGPQNLKVIVDTQDLVPFYKALIDVPIHVFPVPYSGDVLPNRRPLEPHKWVCWCRGLILPSRGLEVISKLLNTTGPMATQLKIVFGQDAFTEIPETQVDYEAIPPILSVSEYNQCMADSDFVLLPYHPEAYPSNSSGVFIEAVIYGKIPLVNDGTWTASELRRYQLEDLILDWDRPDLAAEIARLGQDGTVRQRLKVMQEAYENYHCIRAFAEHMAAIHP